VVPEFAVVFPDELPLVLPPPPPPQPNEPAKHARKRQTISAAFSKLRRETVIAANRKPRAITPSKGISLALSCRLICGVSKAVEVEAAVVFTVMAVVLAAPETLT
jgi:hypothetical protein